jgi:hypothetical protein
MQVAVTTPRSVPSAELNLPAGMQLAMNQRAAFHMCSSTLRNQKGNELLGCNTSRAEVS